MERVTTNDGPVRRAQARLRMIQHCEEVTRNVSKTCRFFGISRNQFYRWLHRFRREGAAGLRDRPRRPRPCPHRTPPQVEALVLRVRQERQYGVVRLSLLLRRYHQIRVSAPTIYRILKAHRVPRVSLKRYRPGPRRHPELQVPGQSVQVDVKHIKLGSGRLYQFTAIDEATLYRILKVYDHNSIQLAIAFVEALRQALPVAIQRIQTDHGSEFGTDFTWHLHDLGIAHCWIPPGCPEASGKVERSHRTDEDEFYCRTTSRDRHDLVRQIQAYEREYNDRRPHLALRGMTPAERLCELRIGPVPLGVRSA